jgi:hypothetical protein
MTETTQINTTAVLNTVRSLVRRGVKNQPLGVARLHQNPNHGTVHTGRELKGNNTISSIVSDEFNRVGHLRNFTMDITGLVASAIILNGGDANARSVVNNTANANNFYAAAGFSPETISLMEFAYYPHNGYTGTETKDELAAMNFQRRIRRQFSNRTGMRIDCQAAYDYLVTVIANNTKDGVFRPAREDYRAVS